MEHRNQSNGLQTFLEHWGLVLTAVIAVLASQVLMFFRRLSGTPWIWFFVASFALMVLGGGLVVYAKLPVYRNGRFFTFGLKSVPEHLLRFYRRDGEYFYSVLSWGFASYCRGHEKG
jgi:hypothetical protein